MGKKGLTNEQWNQISKIIQKENNERKNEKIDLSKSVLPKLENEIKNLGFNFNNVFEIKKICQDNPDITKNSVICCYKDSIYNTEKSFLLECLYSYRNTDLIPFFIEELYKNDSSFVRVVLGNCLLRTPDKKYIDNYMQLMYDKKLCKEWPYIGNCISNTADIKYKDNYLEMLNDINQEQSLVYIIWTVSKLKIKEAIPSMISMLNNHELCYHILEALNKYKDPNLLPYFEKYKNDDNADIRNAAKKGIKTIEELLKIE